MPYETFCAEGEIALRGLTFWQHWVPCRLHLASSVYVAKEDGVVLGLISTKNIGKSRACWRIEHLVVHPTHRGRGIAQELLRFAFALFGSQGVNHFIAEVSDQNSAGLNILGNCGFRRCAKITHYQVPADYTAEVEGLDFAAFRLALPEDKQRLFILHQDSLPLIIALFMSWCRKILPSPICHLRASKKSVRSLSSAKPGFGFHRIQSVRS